MRAIIIVMIFIIIFNNCDGIVIPFKNIGKNLDKAVKRLCNNEAYNITNNSNMFNCLAVNMSYDCKFIENFTEYQKIRIICIDRNNSEFGMGVFIAIISWLVIILMCHK